MATKRDKSNLTFVFAGSDSGRLDAKARKCVRSRAMEDFRKRQREERRERVERAILCKHSSPASTTSSHSLSAAQFELQLQHHFSETCCPPDVSGKFNASTLRYGTWPQSASTSPRHAASLALSTLNLALDSRSPKALQGFYELYRQSLYSLRLRTYEGCLKDENLANVLAANYLLSLVEAMMSCSHNETGWQWHSRGLLDLIRSSGGDAICIADEQLESIPGLQTWRTMALSRALLQRQGLPGLYFDESISGECESFANLAFKVPGCLERLAGVTSSTAIELAVLTMDEALRLRESLREFGLEAANPCFELPLEDFKTFESWLGSDLCCVFPTVYDFPDIRSAGLHQTRWMCLLELNKAILEVRSLFPEPQESLGQENLREEMDGCAASLCWSLPFLSSPRMKSIGMVASTKPLYFARRYFESCEKTGESEKRLEWCWRVDREVTLGYKLKGIELR